MDKNTIILIRNYLNLTQRELSRRVGISNTTICKMETGVRPVGHGYVKKISDEFKIPVSTLYLFDEKLTVNSSDLNYSELTEMLSWYINIHLKVNI